MLHLYLWRSLYKKYCGDNTETNAKDYEKTEPGPNYKDYCYYDVKDKSGNKSEAFIPL